MTRIYDDEEPKIKAEDWKDSRDSSDSVGVKKCVE